MKWRWWLWSLAACAPADLKEAPDVDGSLEPIAAYDPIEETDLFIATAGVGIEVASVSPGAAWPNGMTIVSPNTSTESGFLPPFYAYVGYHGGYEHLRSISLVHAHGIGIVDQGAVPFMVRDGWDPRDAEPLWPVVPFDKETEAARPGWYRLHMTDQDIEVEVAATERGAHLVFRFAEGAEPVVQLDMGHTLPGVETAASHVMKGADGAFSGEHRIEGGYSDRFGGSRTFFAGQFTPAPVGGGVWQGPDDLREGASEASGEGETAPGAWWVFEDGVREVHLQVAVSYTDEEGARRNLEAEHPDLDFDGRRLEAEEAWRQRLSRVRVRGGTPRDRRIFHTAMYRTLLMPSRQDDVDGRYRGFDQELQTTDHPYYSDFSLWDTYRTVHPWYLLVWPELQADLDRSLIRMTRDGGSLPRWPMTHGYTGGMIGTPAVQVLAESDLKGVLPEDLREDAMAFSIRACTEPQERAGRRAIDFWTREDGWIPIESGGGAVSHALEYAWSDAVLADWLSTHGRDEDADRLRQQSRNWRSHWSDKAGFFVGRFADGTYRDDIDPYVWSNDYVEGNAWHYLWMLPWDVPGLIEVQHGGDRDALLQRLSDYWDRVYVEEKGPLPDDDYWHGNEPVMAHAVIAALAGDPDLTAEAARWILENRYDDTPEKGLDGNDDAGTLSAWATWHAIGLFPIAGTTDLVVSSPLFERAEIDRPDGTTVVMRAPGASSSAIYVGEGASLGGEPLTGPVVDHQRWLEAELVLPMSEEPGGREVTW